MDAAALGTVMTVTGRRLNEVSADLVRYAPMVRRLRMLLEERVELLAAQIQTLEALKGLLETGAVDSDHPVFKALVP